MFTTGEKRGVVEKILHSKEFRDSPVSAKLLQYLAHASFTNTIPKETTIAIEVFGKDSNFNSNKDATVRYHIHLLRKKLFNYYKTEGKNDKIRLFIPKGRYEIEFTSSKIPYCEELFSHFFHGRPWEMILILVLLLISIVLFILLINAHSRTSSPVYSHLYSVSADDKFWGPFLKNGYPVMLILGDDFFLDEYHPGYKRYRQIRDWQIDSENDLANFLIQFPNAKLWKSEITGFPVNGIQNLMDILPILYQFQPEVNVTYSSTVSLENIRKHNMIYIGELKNLRILNKIFNKLPIGFQYHPDERLFILGEKGDTLQTYHRIEAPYAEKNKYNVDYSLLIKIPGLSDEQLMFIVGFGYGGRLERTKMLANRELREKFIHEIERIHKFMPEYFIVLFEVKSIERTGFTNEIKFFKEIPKDFFNPQ